MLSFILLRSVYLFYYWCLFWSADFPFFWIWFTVSIDNTNSFLDLVSDVIFIFFPIWDPVPLQSERQLCTSTDLSMIHHWIGSITVLITRMRKFIGFDSFACSLQFWLNYFAVLRFWMIFSTVLLFLIDPNGPIPI